MFPIFAGNSASTGYNLTRSLRFRASASASLSRTPASTTNQKTYTYSLWFKRGALGTSQSLLNAYYGGSSRYSMALINSSNVLEVFSGIYSTGGSTTTSYYYVTTQVFRDPSAWYHLVVAVDTTQATAANRVKIYVNGSQVTAFSTSTTPAQNADGYFNVTTTQNNIGQQGSTQYFDGYLTEVNFIDGQALTPSSFGSTSATTGVWQPARYTGTYGTNGFYLPFTDNSALTTSSNVGLGKDFSGNGNYWTTNNISITAGVTYDSMTDVPTLTSATAANFAVMNPVFPSGYTLTNGNLNVSSTVVNNYSPTTIALPSTGKFYFEYACLNTAGSNRRDTMGVVDLTKTVTTLGEIPNSVGYLSLNGNAYQNSTILATYTTYTNGDIAQCAFDCDTGKVWFGLNGTFNGSPSAGTGQVVTLTNNGNLAFAVSNFANSTSAFSVVGAANFGQRPFFYTPPTGFVALNTYNLPTSTIVKGNTVFDATLYTGTLLSNAVTNAASFKPDFVWLKSRSAATGHEWTDSVRGVTKSLSSNSTAVEATDVQGLTAFNTNGFTVGTNTDYNNLAATYVAWQWQAGQGSTSSNTNGTITSTVSVNASAGFSVVTYTGTGALATVGHGLGVAPSMYIIKQRAGSTGNWGVYHKSIGPNYALFLDLTDASTTATVWNNTAPTSSVFTIGAGSFVNGNGGTYVAYCWTPIAGFSAFGSYTGNGSADGPFVYTGFLPRWIMIKRTDTTANWRILDTSRDTYNVEQYELYPNLSNAEGTFSALDGLSNGFKIRTSDAAYNASGGTYIYAAFATNPFKNSLAR